MSDPLVKNASDPEQIREARRRSRRKDSAEDGDLRAVMATAHGRRFVWRVLGMCGVRRISFDGSPGGWTDFREGMRSVGLWLEKSAADVCPDEYLLMIRERMAADPPANDDKKSVGQNKTTEGAQDDEHGNARS